MTTQEAAGAFEVVGATLPAWPDPGVAIAASRAGATGLLNLEHTTDRAAARTAVDRLAAFGRGSRGVKLRAGTPLAAELLPELPPAIGLVVLTAAEPAVLGAAIALSPGRRVLVECTTVEAARAALQAELRA